MNTQDFNNQWWPVTPDCTLFHGISWMNETTQFGWESSIDSFEEGNYQQMSLWEWGMPGMPSMCMLSQLDQTRTRVRIALIKLPETVTTVLKYYRDIDEWNMDTALSIFAEGDSTEYNRGWEKLVGIKVIRKYYMERRKLQWKHEDYFGTLTYTGNRVSTVWVFVCTDGRRIPFSDSFEFNTWNKVIKRVTMFDNPGAADR